MERICQLENLNRAYQLVKSNRGSPGIDGMSVADLAAWLKSHKEELIAGVLDGSYRPQEVRGVEIPKAPGGGKRQSGMPTVVDRLVQQAIVQVLDPTFSESSYGFRTGRSAYLLGKGADAMAVNRQGPTTVDKVNGAVQRIQPWPQTIKLVEGLGVKNNHDCLCW